MVRTRFCLALLLAFFVVLLSACGGGDADESAADAPLLEVDNAPAPSPLETELGFASEPGRRQYQLITMQRDAESSIVQCMSDAGFFYAAGQPGSRLRSGAFVGDGSPAWTTSNGLGITSSFRDALSSGVVRSGVDAEAANNDFVASLTSEQAAQYDAALIGERVEGEETVEYAPGGCWAGAFTDIVRVVALVDEFEPELMSLNSRLNADPRVRAMQKDWSSCMAEAGHRYDNEAAMVDAVYAQLLEVELVDNDGATQVADPDSLDAVFVFEKQVALASFDCRESFVDDLADLRNDYEREFLDDNRFRIADLQAPSQ